LGATISRESRPSAGVIRIVDPSMEMNVFPNSASSDLRASDCSALLDD
jgi:hypothetical protein